MVRVLVLVASLVLAGPLAAFAQAADPEAAEAQVYARDGLYIGAGIAGLGYQGISSEVEHAVGRINNSSVTAASDAAAAANLRIGYRLHPRVAGEVQWEWVVPTDVELSGGNIDPTADPYELKAWVVTANLKGYVVDSGNFQPYLLVGGGMISAELDDKANYGFAIDDFAFLGRMGGGVEYYFTPHIVGTVDVTYVLPIGDLDAFDYVSGGVGIQYRF